MDVQRGDARAVVKILGCPEPDYPGQPFVLLRGLAISIDASVPDGEIAREVDDPDPE